jgi:hypothetical protein
MSKSAPQVVSISTPRYGEAVRTGDNRVIYTPTPGRWIPGDCLNETIAINMIAGSPPETTVTDAAELRLQDAMNDRAERTTALDVALQGLDDVVRRLRTWVYGDGETVRAIHVSAEIAYYKAKAYRAEEVERAARNAPRAGLASLDKADVAALRSQRDRYRTELEKILFQVKSQLSSD